MSFQNSGGITPIRIQNQSAVPLHTDFTVGYVLIALGLISLIGSLVAAGMLYSQLGTLSWAIGAAGIILSVTCFALLKCSYKKIPTAIPSAPPQQEQNIPVADQTIQQPPLSNLHNLKFEESHPLSKELPKTHFSLSLDGDLFDDDLFDDDLLDITLNFWLYRNPKSIFAKDNLKILNDPNRKAQIALLDTRIQELASAIPLKTRVKKLIPFMGVRDILPAWDVSPLRFSLLLNQEIRQLKVSSITELDNLMVHRALSNSDRLLKASKKKKEFSLPRTFTKESIKEISLLDLPQLKAEDIHCAPQDFPPLTFALISRKELRKIKTELLSTEQLEFLFSAEYEPRGQYHLEFYVNLLHSEQVNACIHLIKNKKFFQNLSDEHTVNFDLSKMDQEIFDALFELHKPESLTRLKALQGKITACYKFFGDHKWYWNAVDEKQRPKSQPNKSPSFPPLLKHEIPESHSLGQELKIPGAPKELLDISFFTWINPYSSSATWDKQLALLNDPLNKPHIALVNTRIQALDTEIQLRARVEKFGYRMITISELLAPWSASSYKLKLISDEELSQLTVAHIAQLGHDEIVRKALEQRIVTISKTRSNRSLTTVNVEDILLVDLPHLKAEHIHNSAQAFPPLTFVLIDVVELKKIETERLSTAQLHYIFNATYVSEFSLHYYVGLLKQSQIQACLHLIQDGNLLVNLSDDQILNLDYSKVTQRIFDFFFRPYRERTGTLFSQLPDPTLLSMKHLIGTALKEKLTPHQISILETRIKPV